MLFDDSYMQDPHTVLARLREDEPVHHTVTPNGLKVWVVSRYEDVRAAFADPRLSKDFAANPGIFERNMIATDGDRVLGAPAIQNLLNGHMANSDPPDHTRLRKLVGQAFTMRRVEKLRPGVERVVDELLDRVAREREVDLVRALSLPLPLTVICDLLGVPQEDQEMFRVWVDDMLSTAQDDSVRNASGLAMAGYLQKLVAAKRENPADDMLTGLIEARDGSDRLREEELVPMVFLLLVAGHETTASMIGNGTLTMLKDPGLMARLRADPDLLPAAVEEFIRFEPPGTMATFRFTAQDTTIGGVTIPADSFVLLSVGAANRDENRFPDPGEVDVSRSVSGHMSFGHGIHFCLGAPLARMELAIVFRKLITRFPKLRLAVPADQLRWRHSLFMHGLEALPVIAE
ncbi:MAG: cytochrome P450 [Actinophytocola sp.]|uniref:cytochrome P450 family protein n=1 Tax=Actinophytocola sp. TaxID=1872138 RepID=UPI003C78BF23